MEQKPLFINKDEPKEPSLNFDLLRAEGIKKIQELCGAFWTDYNEHDPGVTILEQLCYALTDLAYRTNFDIQDHLFNDNKSEHSFFKANQILPCNPITINDYRKKIFDHIFEVKNVWLQPVSSDVNTLKGLYNILLYIDEESKDDKAKEEIIERTKDVFCANRNICEDLEQVKILKPLYFSIHASIETDGSHDLEETLAKIYFLVDQYICPAIRFYSLEELLEEGYELSDIFNGPLLKHGFIKTSELTPKPDKILVSEVIKIIMQVEGVVSVKNIFIKVGEEIHNNQLNIDEEHIPRMIVDVDQKKNAISFFKGTLNYANLDNDSVSRKLNELQSANTRVYRLSEENIEIPKGRSLNIEQYFSVQNQFPVNYGISSYGVPDSKSTERVAQAKQLKGYLMIYEQLMVNYLSQLANAKNLLSIKGDDNNTYFYQYLDEVPLAKDLYKDKEGISSDDPLIKEIKLSLSYKEGIKQLVAYHDNFRDRRNRFLDYLLALHGESFKHYSFSQFNFYFNDKENELHHIETKKRLLEYLPFINSNRAKGFNYRIDSLSSSNQAGMESKISVLLGLGIGLGEGSGENLYLEESLTNSYKTNGLNLYSSDASKAKRKVWDTEGRIENAGLTEVLIDQHFDLVDDEEISLKDYSEEQKKQLLNATLPFQSKTLLTEYLREGIDLYKYKIGRISENEDTYLAVYKNQQEQKYVLIGRFNSETEASVAVMSLVEFLKNLNIKSEGMQLLEHILLRPDTNDVKFGFYMVDEHGKPFLRSTALYNYSERSKVIEKLKAHVSTYSNYSVEATAEKDFQVHFKTPDNDINLIGVEVYESVEETHERMEHLFRFMSDELRITPYEDKIDLYIQSDKNLPHMPEDFFSCRISIMLPDWTARLHDKEFRSIVESVIVEHRPANVSSKCFWLNPQEMEAFENLYYEWMKVKSQVPVNKENIDKLSNDLLQMLMVLYNQSR
jgi:hypothetical protein